MQSLQPKWINPALLLHLLDLPRDTFYGRRRTSVGLAATDYSITTGRGPTGLQRDPRGIR